MKDLEIKITTDEEEVREAQKLRFQVFNLELNKGLQSSYEQSLDVDEFDPYCEHVIVRDLKSKEVIGTYRLLLGSHARKHIGFYSEREFILENIKKLSGEVLELGRSNVQGAEEATILPRRCPRWLARPALCPPYLTSAD